ncbi:MAG TPA: nicotinate phosphoribosyltransferase [Acidimicrobiales bacterium]|nr:nicotinate phosphoribosyltransferase [Acidimicrobiales bacterium]
MTGGLLTDLYELTMAASYLRRKMCAAATFSLYVRELPTERGFLVAAGIEDALDRLGALRFDAGELAYLAGLGFDEAALAAFAEFRFSGDVWAVPEGRVVYAREPLLEVTAPLPEAQLVETLVLNQVTFQTALASKAARCRVAGAGRVELVEFGFRRTHGTEAAIAAAKVTGLVGFAGTSNVEAARRHGLQPVGTMAHSYVEAFPREIDAFRAYARDLPGPVTFLVDTYDTMTGVARAIEVINEIDDEPGPPRPAAVRIDSGDLVALARQARRALDAAGLSRVRILVSGGLDEHDVARLVREGAPVDSVGIGTRIGVSADAPFLDTAYKLVEYAGRPAVKLSPGKASLPGAKQVFRTAGGRDVLALRSEPAPPGSGALLEPVMRGGRRVGARESILAGRARFEADLAHVPAAALALDGPVPPDPTLSDALAALDARARASAGAS